MIFDFQQAGPVDFFSVPSLLCTWLTFHPISISAKRRTAAQALFFKTVLGRNIIFCRISGAKPDPLNCTSKKVTSFAQANFNRLAGQFFFRGSPNSEKVSLMDYFFGVHD